MNSKPQFLTIEEKRAWLARIFRDTSGEYTDADKLKALEADNRLVELNKTHKELDDKIRVEAEFCPGSDCLSCKAFVRYGDGAKRCSLIMNRTFKYNLQTHPCPHYEPEQQSTES